MNLPVRVLDFDGSIPRQKNLLAQHHPEIVDCTDIGPRARFWMGPKVRGILQDRISGSPSHATTLLGSGDFHQVCPLLLEIIPEPVSLLVFDNHPDWDILPPRLHCGSWITEALKNKNILRIVLLGVSSRDISSLAIQTGNLEALRGDRLEIYPWTQSPTRVWFRQVPSNHSIRVERGILSDRIVWTSFRERDPVRFMAGVIERLPAKNVYCSIDKDCLTREHAITNWEEGKMALDDLAAMLSVVRKECNIVGTDICGDYSPIRVAGALKKLCSQIDHPRHPSLRGIRHRFNGGQRSCKSADASVADNLVWETATRINEQTNLRLLNVLISQSMIS